MFVVTASQRSRLLTGEGERERRRGSLCLHSRAQLVSPLLLIVQFLVPVWAIVLIRWLWVALRRPSSKTKALAHAIHRDFAGVGGCQNFRFSLRNQCKAGTLERDTARNSCPSTEPWRLGSSLPSNAAGKLNTTALLNAVDFY